MDQSLKNCDLKSSKMLNNQETSDIKSQSSIYYDTLSTESNSKKCSISNCKIFTCLIL